MLHPHPDWKVTLDITLIPHMRLLRSCHYACEQMQNQAPAMSALALGWPTMLSCPVLPVTDVCTDLIIYEPLLLSLVRGDSLHVHFRF